MNKDVYITRDHDDGIKSRNVDKVAVFAAIVNS